MSEPPMRLIGLPNLERKLKHNPEWAGKPIGEMFDKWRYAVQRRTVAQFKRGKGGWIDKNDDRRSVTSDRDKAIFPVWARAGSNSKTFRFGEFGTGLLSEDPDSKKTRHWPPAAALDAWARRKQIPSRNNPDVILTGADIARIIGMRGGIEPRRYLRTAHKEVQPKIVGWQNQLARALEAAADDGT